MKISGGLQFNILDQRGWAGIEECMYRSIKLHVRVNLEHFFWSILQSILSVASVTEHGQNNKAFSLRAVGGQNQLHCNVK